MTRDEFRYSTRFRAFKDQLDQALIEVRAQFDQQHAMAIARRLFPDLIESDRQCKVFESFLELLRLELKISTGDLADYRARLAAVNSEYDSHDFPGWLQE